MINVGRLQEILNDTTAVLTKEGITHHYLDILEIPVPLRAAFAPVEDWPSYIVDFSFAAVGVNTQLAARHLTEFDKILASFPQPEVLKQGPSYRHFIPYVGSELNALRFVALGDALGLWTVITPKDMGIPEEQQSDLALMGLVCISGYPSTAVESAQAAVS